VPRPYTEIRDVRQQTGQEMKSHDAVCLLTATLLLCASLGIRAIQNLRLGDDRIVLDSMDLAPDAVVFRDEASSDGGKSWRLRSEYHMRRRGGAAASQ
jgi:hypothetical protein